MDSEERVELDFSALDNGELLLKYGPLAKARSYAATHYGYMSNGRYGQRCHSNEPGTILLDMSQHWHNMRQDERVTLERDHYYIKLHGFQSNAILIKNMLCLPGMEVQLARNEVGLERHSRGYETDEEWAVKIPKSFDYDEWMGQVSLIRQASRSLGYWEIKQVKETQHKSKALEAEFSRTKMWNLTEEEVLPEGKARPTRETRPEQQVPPKKGVRHDIKIKEIEGRDEEKLQGERNKHEKKELRPERDEREGSEQHKRRPQHKREGRHKGSVLGEADIWKKGQSQHKRERYERRARREKVAMRRRKGFIRRLLDAIFG